MVESSHVSRLFTFELTRPAKFGEGGLVQMGTWHSMPHSRRGSLPSALHLAQLHLKSIKLLPFWQGPRQTLKAADVADRAAHAAECHPCERKEG